MASIRTTISIDEGLFQRVEKLAKELGISRSRLVSLALEHYLVQHDARKSAHKLDEGHADRSEEQNKE